MTRSKKWLWLCLFLLLFSLPAIGQASGTEPETVTLTRAEYNQLVSNSQRLGQIISILQTSSPKLASDLLTALDKLATAEKLFKESDSKLTTAQDYSKKQDALIATINESFVKLAKEQKSALKKAEIEGWVKGLVGAYIGYEIGKRTR
ncbi:MAG: hypothetical protein RIN56_12310 [Sporomusaceae bacterium]|nr:hypothetical protein [Sporomusaceae bacterium]